MPPVRWLVRMWFATAGKFGFMPVYGAETLNGDAVGKSAGSVITLKVNGEVAEQTVTWTENGDRIRISELTTANKNNGNLPTSFTLNQNYPNPFNPETTIDYVVAQSGHVELSIYNILGDKIKTLVSGYQAAGSYSVKWQSRYRWRYFGCLGRLLLQVDGR